jgi:hypothetical protein
MKTSIRFNFPNSTYDQWLLLWISNPFIHRKIISCTLHFVEVQDLTDSMRRLTEEKENNYHEKFERIVPYHLINLLHTGNIYDKNGNLLKSAKNFGRRPFDLPVDNKIVNDKIGSITHDDVIKHLGVSSSPLLEIEDFRESLFLIKEMTFNGKTTYFLIPHFVLFQFFYNISTKVTEQLIHYRTPEIFGSGDLKLIKEEDKIILEAKYDNRRISKREITNLLKRLAYGINSGYGNIIHIGSNIISSLMNNELTTFMVTPPLNSEYELKIVSKSLGNNLNIAYDIISIDKNKQKPIFERINLVEKFPPSIKDKSQSDRDTEIEKGVKITNTKPKDLPLEITADVGFRPSEEEVVEYEDDIFDLDIKSTTVTEPEKSNHNHVIIEQEVQNEFDGINPNTNGIEQNNQNLYKNFLVHFDIFERSEYIRAIVDSLEPDLDHHSYVQLSNESYADIGFAKTYHGKSYDIIIVEMIKNSNHYYLIEFTFGHTQLMSWLSSRDRVSNYDMNLLIDSFIDRYNYYLTHKRKVKLYLEDNKTNERYLKLDSPESKIKLFPGIEHQHEHMDGFDFLVNHTKEKILSRINEDLKSRKQV